MTENKTPGDLAAPPRVPARGPGPDDEVPAGAPAAVGDAPPIGPEALKAFAHPLRMAMYRYLTAHGSGTASALARHTGESTGQTSYHLRQLERHGLIEDDPERAGSGRERWWRPTGFSLDPRTFDDPAVRLAADVALRALVDERSELLLGWFDRAQRSSVDPWVDASMHNVATGDLTVDELANLRERLGEVLDDAFAAAKARKAADGPAGRRRVRAYVDAFPLDVTD